MTRYLCTSSKDGQDDDNNKNDDKEGSVYEDDGDDSDDDDGTMTHALAPISIPDYFPNVPIIPINRNPLFPKFVKIIEV